MMNKKEAIQMPALKDYASRKEWEAACWKKIVESEDLLQLLITPHERHDIVMRAAAVHGLASGKSYREIGNELWLSPQTISGIKKAMAENGYRSYLERSKKERKPKTQSIIRSSERKSKRAFIRTKYGKVYMP